MGINKGWVRNLLSLAILQGSLYLIPLLSLPYLTRVLGIEGYGLLVMVQSVIFYFTLVTDYGFNLSATKAISVRLATNSDISDIISNVYAVKLCLGLASFLILAIVTLLIPFAALYRLELFAASSAILGTILFPTWFFQGIQKLEWITILTLIGRVAFLILLFYFVQDPGDIVVAIFLQSGAGLAIGLFAILVMKRFHSFTWKIPSYHDFRFQLESGWHVFLSQISTTFFLNTNVLILSFFGSFEAVGRYGVAERLIKAAIGLSIPISVSIYPHVNQLFVKGTQEALHFLKRILLYGGLFMALVSVSVFILSPHIVFLMVGQDDAIIVLLIRVMSILPLSVFLDNIYGTQILLSVGADRQMMMSLAKTSLIAFLGSILLIPFFFELGAAVNFLVAEIFLLILFIRESHKLGHKIQFK
jgi:PST family polysaccharide transporter